MSSCREENDEIHTKIQWLSYVAKGTLGNIPLITPSCIYLIALI